jgi:hypothetical protein
MKVWGSFQAIPGLRWEMAPTLDSGIICVCEDMTLKEAYNLYGIACIKDVSIAIHLELYSGSI